KVSSAPARPWRPRLVAVAAVALGLVALVVTPKCTRESLPAEAVAHAEEPSARVAVAAPPRALDDLGTGVGEGHVRVDEGHAARAELAETVVEPAALAQKPERLPEQVVSVRAPAPAAQADATRSVRGSST